MAYFHRIKQFSAFASSLLFGGLLCGPLTANAAVIGSHSMYAPGDALPESGDFVLQGNTWSSSTISYSFMATGTSTGAEAGHGPSFSALADFMPAGWKSEIEAAFDSWEAVAGLNFVEVADDGVAWNTSPTTGHGDIRFGGATFDGPNGTLAHGYYPPPNGNTAAGDIHFDIAETWKIGFGGGGFDIFQVAAHEIGHAIGLEHTGVPGSLMNPTYTEAFSGPQADDVSAAQTVYGEAFGPAIPEPSTGLLFAFALVFLLRLKNLTSEDLQKLVSFAGVSAMPIPVRGTPRPSRRRSRSPSRSY